MLDAAGLMALVRNPRGIFLPGGGAEPDETPEDTLRREVREESGYGIATLERLGEAVEFVFVAGNVAGLRKLGTFFRAMLGERIADATEAEDRVFWTRCEAAPELLTFGSQSWAVRRLLGATSP